MNDLYIHQLETENKQLKEALKSINLIVEEYLEIEKHCDELENKIDKAIEYIKNHEVIENNLYEQSKAELLEILQNDVEEQEQSKIKFLLNGCDISFYATAPEDITLKQLLKQCDRIKPNYCACGICSEDFKDENVELIIDYDDIKKANDDVSCEILGDKE